MTLKARLRKDMTGALKARDELRMATLRLALSAVTTQEVAGEQARELSDDEVEQVLAREAKKRRESAEAYDRAGRVELADRERAEGEVLAGYLPAQLTDDELAELVRAAVTESGASGPRAIGTVMKLVSPRVHGRADGGRVAAVVRQVLAG